MYKYATALTILMASGISFMNASTAQVIRYQDAEGRTVYSDHACGFEGKAIGNLTVNSVNATRIETQNPSVLPDEKSYATATKNCPSEQEVRSIETSLSSTSLRGNERRNEREFLQGEVRRARACSKEGGHYSAEDWRQIKAAQAAQNNSSEEDRATARAMAEGIHATAASDREVERMRIDQLVRARRDADEAAVNAAPKPQTLR